LNPWQAGFCEWNADRLGIPVADSTRRYRASWQAVPGGHAGAAFRKLCETQMAVLSVIADDSPAEVYDCYVLHDWLYLLRQIALPVPVWDDRHPVVRAMANVRAPVIVDYGCGVAQTSISLALTLREKGAEPRLALADIPTTRLDFVAWLCARLGLSCRMLACTRNNPLPEFPPADVVVAVEIFEHLHDPLPALTRLDSSLCTGGFLITNVRDHDEEFTHVSPKLGRLREWLTQRGYAELDRHVLFRKAAVTVPEAAAVARDQKAPAFRNGAGRAMTRGRDRDRYEGEGRGRPFPARSNTSSSFRASSSFR
jgi:SAM-dependent methyltransferase